MSFLLVTIPVSLLLAACLLWLVVRAAREGAFDDWEGPAQRHLYDDDANPEIDSAHSEIGPDKRGGASRCRGTGRRTHGARPWHTPRPS